MGNRPLPEINDVNRPYWDAACRGELKLPKCDACGNCFFPPRAWCPHCFSNAIGWVPAIGLATIVSFSKLYAAPFEGYVSEFPYVLATVKLAERPQMMANIVNCDPDTIAVGATVKVTFEERDEGIKIPQFEPL